MNDIVSQNLFIVRDLKPHEKLNTCEQLFSVQSPAWTSGLYRRWAGERRSLNISRVQEQFEIGLLRHESGHADMLDLLVAALTGLEQLKMTYADDKQVVSQLSVLCVSARTRITRVSPGACQFLWTERAAIGSVTGDD